MACAKPRARSNRNDEQEDAQDRHDGVYSSGHVNGSVGNGRAMADHHLVLPCAWMKADQSDLAETLDLVEARQGRPGVK
jgi:hypothetical protein